MKKTLLACAAGTVLAAAGTSSHADLSANVALTTDYVWRGVSQTDNSPALQGGVDWSTSGFYAGVWASNVDFGSGNDADYELDWYFGGEATTASGWTIGAGFIQYYYPGSDDADRMDEASISIGYGPFSAAYNFNMDLGGVDAPDYIEVALDFTIIGDVGLTLHAGGWDNADNDMDYKIALSKEFSGVGVELAATGTDLQCGDPCDDIVALTASMEF